MAKVYDPILCMMVEEPTKAQDAMPSDLKKAGYEVGTVEKYGSTYYTLVYNGKVISASPTEANIVEKAKKHYANRNGSANTKDASRGHEIVVKTQNYLNSIGKNNSVGKYDRIVHGVKSLLEQGFLEGPELERAIKQEADRLLKKYNLDERPEGMKDASPIPVVKVIETKGKYSIIQDDRGLYWVTVDKTGHGGGTAEVNLSNARRTLEHYILMDKLEAKYGKKEGYKRYLAGETDECPEGMTCDKRSIDEAIRMCDKDVSFPSEKEAIEYCKENGIDPHKIKTIGDKYVVSE